MSQAIINESTLSNLADVTRTIMSDEIRRTPDECVNDLSGIMIPDTAKYKSEVKWSSRTTLKDLEVNRFAIVDVNSQTDMANMFYYCRKLSSLSLPEGFGANATSLSTCFKQCIALSSISLPEGFGAKATNMFGCFESCSSLNSLDLPEGFGAKATNVRYIFARCSSLLSLDLPETFFDWPSATVQTPTTSMFYGCYSLRSVNLPSSLSTIANYSGMFYQCSSLTSLDFPDGFGSRAYAPDAANNVFFGCTSLSAITGDLAMWVSFSLKDCPLAHESLINVLNSIQTVTTKPTLTLGTANLAKLSDDEKKIATDKGWILA